MSRWEKTSVGALPPGGHRPALASPGPGEQSQLKEITHREQNARSRKPRPSPEWPGAAAPLSRRPGAPRGTAGAASLPAQLGEGLEIQLPDLLLTQPVAHPLPLQEGLHGAGPERWRPPRQEG